MKLRTIALGVVFLSTVLLAMSPEERGLEIAIAADARDNGFIDQRVDMRMVLRNRYGQESSRALRLQTLEVKEDGDKSLTIFDSPRDVKGTAFLSFTHKSGPDDQWLYLPALRRVKRIASNNKSGPFMGSEFAYEDITSQEIEKYTYKYRETVQLDGEAHYLIERYPVDKNSGYTKQEVYLDTKEYRVKKIVFYDRKGKRLKTLSQTKFEEFPVGKIKTVWRPKEMHMVNHQSGKETSLYWESFAFNTGLTDDDFSKNALKRVR